MFTIPDSINKYNLKYKDEKTKQMLTKIATLDDAKAFRLKRMFSGSFAADYITGGGFAYRRIQLLFGAKSCIDEDSFISFDVYHEGKCINSKGGSIRRLYERFTGDISEGSKYGRHLQNKDAIYYVKSIDTEGHVIRNEILDVVKTGKKECYRVTTESGHYLISTAKHKYITPEGYKALGNLKIGDKVYVNTNDRVKGRKATISRPDVYVKYHPNLPTKIIKDKYKGKETDYLYYRGQQSRISYEAFLNNMTYEEYVSFLDTKSKKEIDGLRFLSTNIHVHHKDENFLNNDISNLELVDPSEHGRLHMSSRLNNLRILVRETTIINIEPVGMRETYDIQCAHPYNNYIANNIVVHNSGKNALVNQTTAYLQRMCRNCHGVLQNYVEGYKAKDHWSFILLNILGVGICTCDKPEAKKVLFLDYERALAIEEPRDVKVHKMTNAKTGEIIDELDYNDAVSLLEQMSQTTEEITQEQKDKIKETEKFLKNIKIEEAVVRQIGTTAYLRKCGIQTNQLLVADPEDTEEGIEIVREMVSAREIDLIVWDSLQAAIPRYVRDRDADQATMGVEAKQNGLLMKHVCSAFAAGDVIDEMMAYKPALIITSQVRSTLGGFIAAPDTYSGGNAIQHHISIALEVKREKFLKEDGSDATFKDNFYGQKVRLRADKNKFSAPGDMFEYSYFFREGESYPVGIDSIEEIAELGVKTNVVGRAGTYYIIGEDKFQGRKQRDEYLRSNPQVVSELYSNIMSKL